MITSSEEILLKAIQRVDEHPERIVLGVIDKLIAQENKRVEISEQELERHFRRATEYCDCIYCENTRRYVKEKIELKRLEDNVYREGNRVSEGVLQTIEWKRSRVEDLKRIHREARQIVIEYVRNGYGLPLTWNENDFERDNKSYLKTPFSINSSTFGEQDGTIYIKRKVNEALYVKKSQPNLLVVDRAKEDAEKQERLNAWEQILSKS